MERAVVLNRSGIIQASDLPADIVPDQGLRSFVVSIGLSLRDIEKKAIEETLRFAKGDKRVAAALLGIHPRTIYRFLEAIEEKNAPEKGVENEVIESGSI
jgi:two-component system response regulator HydG